MSATLYSVIVPGDFNDGSPVNDGARELIEGWLLSYGGGFTRYDSDGSAWRDARTGTIYRDERVSRYDVLVTGEARTTDSDARVKRIAERIADLLDQEAVLWYRTLVSRHGFEVSR